MKKGIMSLAAVAALAIAPNALAVGTWGGWAGEHGDNLASTDYVSHFGADGKGDSRYCVNPGAAYNDCSGALLTSPLVFTGVFVPTGAGCGSTATSHPDTEPNPCDNGDLIGAFYVGTDESTGVGLQG